MILPTPPKVDPSKPFGEQLEFLARTWEECVSKHYLKGKSCWTFKGRGGVFSSKYVDLLDSAIQKFLEHDIAPAPWLMFVFGLWDHSQARASETPLPKKKKGGRACKSKKRRGKMPPPLHYAFSPDLITEHRGWFRREFTGAYAGRIVFTPSYRELIYRYSAMRIRLATLRSPTPERIDHVVHKMFPSGLYGRLVRQSRAEVSEMQDRENHRAARGIWVW